MTNSAFEALAAASGLDIRVEDFEEAISRRNPEAPRATIEQLVRDVTEAAARLSLAPAKVEVGAGLGEWVGPTEGARRLAAFASPLAVKDWAGPVGKPSEITSRFGIARSTLDEWRRAGRAIGLLAGARKHVFPLAQFVDGRPVAGLTDLAAIIGDSRSVWLWLVAPELFGGLTRLEQIRRGRLAEVLAAAHSDFA